MYSDAGNPWRGQRVSPLAANEQEAGFKPACEGARYFAGSTSHSYDHGRLRSGYGYASAAATRGARSTSNTANHTANHTAETTP